MKATTERKRVVVVGAGIEAGRDLTIGGKKAIREAAVVFCSASHEECAKMHMSREARLSLVRRHITSSRLRSESYRRIARDILAALDGADSVVWITQGDPTICCGVTAELCSGTNRARIDVHLFSGVTSQLAVNAILPPEHRFTTFLHLRAKDLFLSQVSLDNRFGVFVIQVFQHVSEKILLHARLRPDSLRPLKTRLTKFYPASHPVYVVNAETSFAPARVQAVTIAELPDSATLITPETTLAIPPVLNRKRRYVKSLERLVRMDEASKGVSLLESLSEKMQSQ